MHSFRSITIIGLGLIGGSLAARCRKKFPRAKIIGITRNTRALDVAKKRGWIHQGYKNLKVPGTIVPGTFCILCTPVDTLKDFLKQLDRVAPPGTVVTDAGSVKGFLVRWADRQKWRRIQFVGAHPMAGSHEQGIGAARTDLFDRALTFVTPGKRPSKFALKTVAEFWRKICAKVLVVSPEVHDRLTAEISHVPHLLASLLVENVSPKSLGVAASGFLDTTRVAKSDPGLWTPILLENRKEIGRVLKNFEKNLQQVKKFLKGRNPGPLKSLLGQAQRRRLALEKGT